MEYLGKISSVNLKVGSLSICIKDDNAASEDAYQKTTIIVYDNAEVFIRKNHYPGQRSILSQAAIIIKSNMSIYFDRSDKFLYFSEVDKIDNWFFRIKLSDQISTTIWSWDKRGATYVEEH